MKAQPQSAYPTSAQGHVGETDESETDEALMQQVRAGDTAKLSGLFARHGDRLFRYCWRMNQDSRLSEDLVQESFCRILRFRTSFQDGRGFQAWMYSIARNLQMDHWRKKRFEADWDEGFDPPAPQGAPLEARQELQLLHEALSRLTPSKREILILARFEELPHEKIAEILGCEPGSARVRLHRALASLRETYTNLLTERRSQA